MPKKVLVVDDKPDVRLALEAELQDAGYEVLQAEDGQKAVKMADPPGAIFMDLHMPEVDGIKAIKTLRESGYGGLIVLATATPGDIDGYLDRHGLGREKFQGYIAAIMPKPWGNGEPTAILDKLGYKAA